MIYKRDDFDFEIVNFPILDGDVPSSTSYGVNISQIIRFARASSYVADFNSLDKLLTQKLLKQGYGIINFAKPFLNFIDDTLSSRWRVSILYNRQKATTLLASLSAETKA